MYTYNKDDKSYTFSSDDLDIESLLGATIDGNKNNDDTEANNNKAEEGDYSSDFDIDSENSSESNKPPKIEIINGGNDLDISPVSNYIEVEKPKNEKKENIIIPEDNKENLVKFDNRFKSITRFHWISLILNKI